MNIPLAERMRPKSLSDYVGQEHLLGNEGILTKYLLNNFIPSIILWGPPGVGKTTLANIISNQLNRASYKLSATNSGMKDVREVIEKAKKNHGLYTTDNPILFIDEIHRFNKSQQDSLLNAVEKGWVTLIGATTENPSFEVIPALLSRCQIYILKEFSKKDLQTILHKAIEKDIFLKKHNITLTQTTKLLALCGGDARKLLNILEIVVNTQSLDKDNQQITITDKLIDKCIQKNLIKYDKQGEQHYDIISAFIKSVRGSNADAAVYWLARMIEGGEDLKFIARRLLILSSEDIGNANPTALVIANNTFQAVNVVGYPESRIILSQCTVYLATSPKSNSVYKAINKAQQVVRKTGNLPVPIHLRNAPTKLTKELGYAQDYKYPHDYHQHFIKQEYLPSELEGETFYTAADNPREQQSANYLKKIRKEE